MFIINNVILVVLNSWDRKNNPYPWQKIKHNERLKVSERTVKSCLSVDISNIV